MTTTWTILKKLTIINWHITTYNLTLKIPMVNAG